MLYNYDLFNLWNEKEVNEMKQVYSIVAYFDILGYKNLVLTDLKKASIISNALSNINKRFNATVQENIEEYEVTHVINKSSGYGVVSGFILPKMKATTFSDSIILSCPMIDNSNQFIISEVIRTLSDIQLFFLREGFLIRGGVTIGNIYHTEKYVFGESVVEAYLLESEVARYPRIIISERLEKLIENLSKNQVYERRNNDFYCLIIDEKFKMQYLRKDIDGKTYIDFLGGLFIRHYIMYLNNNEDFKKDYLNKIETLIEEGIVSDNIKIREKYIWLNKKYNSKLKYLIKHYK